MGNQQSSTKDNTNRFKLPGMIDSIAAKYILTQDFQDMTKLEDKEYCNKLIVLTSKVIAEHLTGMEIEYLSQRTKQGAVIDKLEKEQVLYLENESLKKLDEHNSVTKKRLCIGIAKFYIKVLHVFSAIVATMNPVYSYKNEMGQTMKVPYMKKHTIPESAKGSTTIKKINLCSRRIDSLMMKILDETTVESTPESSSSVDKKYSKEGTTSDKNIIPPLPDVSSKPSTVIKGETPKMDGPKLELPKTEPLQGISEKNEGINSNVEKGTTELVLGEPVSDKPKEPQELAKPVLGSGIMEQPKDLDAGLRNVEKELKAQIGGKIEKTIEIKPSFCKVNKNKDGSQMSLQDEPGIPELKQLYYDVFDYNVAKFTSMSEKSQEEYEKDLDSFYKAFTGKSKRPDTVKSFSDIKLRDFSLHENCKPDGLFNKTFQGSFKNKLFTKYASQLKQMTENANKNREKLIDVLDKLFRYIKDPETKTTKMITLHPKLTEKSLQSIVVETRKLIVQLYISCEQEYLGIIETFESIIETQVKKVTQQKIANLQKQQEELLTDVV